MCVFDGKTWALHGESFLLIQCVPPAGTDTDDLWVTNNTKMGLLHLYNSAIN